MLMYSSIAEKAENDYFFMHSYNNESFNTSMPVCIIGNTRKMNPKTLTYILLRYRKKTFEKPVKYD